VAAYSWYCPEGGETEVTQSPIDIGPVAPECHGSPMLRDYRADSPVFATAELRKTNRVGHDASLFLPDTKYFESPADPDGTKGMRKWNEEHEPKGHSGRTRPGVRESKAVF